MFFQKLREAKNKRNPCYLYFLEVERKAVVDLGFRALRWVTDWDDCGSLFFTQKLMQQSTKYAWNGLPGVETGQGLWYPKQVAHGKAVFDTQEAPKRSETWKNHDFPTFSKKCRKNKSKKWPPRMTQKPCMQSGLAQIGQKPTFPKFVKLYCLFFVVHLTVVEGSSFQPITEGLG